MERRRSAERVLRRLKVIEAHREGRVDPEERERFERVKAALERDGSYRELRAGLRGLRSVSELAWLAVWRAYGPDAELRVVSAKVQALADAGVAWIAERMPDPIRVPASVAGDELEQRRALWRGRSNGHDRARADRGVEVVRLRELERLSWAAIAARVGLSERQARRAYERAREAA